MTLKTMTEFPGGPVVGLHGLTAEGPGSVHGGGTKIPQIAGRGLNKLIKHFLPFYR